MTKTEMLNRLYQVKVSIRATLVLNYLINRANAELTCFPAIKTIAKDCNMSARTVQRALNDLLEAGLIEKDSRFRDNGGQSSNLYTLCLNFEHSLSIEDDKVKAENEKIIPPVCIEDSNSEIELDKIGFDDQDEKGLKEFEGRVGSKAKENVSQVKGMKRFARRNKRQKTTILVKSCHGVGDSLVPP